MNFQELLTKMQELDQPAAEACGDSPMPLSMPPKPDTPPPTMRINLNAQGLDNIEQLMKLAKSVNPDIDKPASPVSSISIAPMDGAMDAIPPLKMLPDFDDDKIDLPPMHDKDHEMIKKLDKDRDGDHDMDDHDLERKSKDEAYGNAFDKTTQILSLLYPNGIKVEQYKDLHVIIRMLDKISRIARDNDPLGESPYMGIAGYSILSLARNDKC